MKRLILSALTVIMVVLLAACGEKKDTETYTSAVDVLTKVTQTGNKLEFPYMGGDFENAKEDEPGSFDLSKKEELFNLGLPESEQSHLEEAASMMHMMNANIFTGAVYKLKVDADTNTFIENVKKELLERQWLCGAPEKMLIMKVSDMYVLTAYGEEKTIDEFKTKAVEALSGAKVSVEAPIQ